jgi:hypothetical protein
MDQLDPGGERFAQGADQLGQALVGDLAVLIELVIGKMFNIGLGLLHDRHVEEHAALAQLVIAAVATEPAREPVTTAVGFFAQALWP